MKSKSAVQQEVALFQSGANQGEIRSHETFTFVCKQARAESLKNSVSNFLERRLRPNSLRTQKYLVSQIFKYVLSLIRCVEIKI